MMIDEISTSLEPIVTQFTHSTDSLRASYYKEVKTTSRAQQYRGNAISAALSELRSTIGNRFNDSLRRSVTPEVREVYDGRRAADAMYVVAHPDDSLLFQSPTLLRQLSGGSRILTVHIAAGDSGTGEDYWRMREAGIASAYAEMTGVTNEWIHCRLTVNGHSLAYNELVDRPGVSVIFIRLPDGGFPAGQGYPGYGSQSLWKLWSQARRSITSVDGVNTFTRADLVETLATLMIEFQPQLIHTLDYVNAFAGEDHMDHYASARFAKEAHSRCSFAHKFVGYTGYPVQDLEENITGPILSAKQSAFYAYGKFDVKACHDEATCSVTPYAAWLKREYVVGSETVGAVADAGLDQFVLPNEEVQLDASLSSAQDNQTMAYEWSQLSGPPVTIFGHHERFASFISPGFQGPLEFSLRVKSGAVESSPAIVTVTVT